MSQDYYRILGLPLPHQTGSHVTTAEIKNAYRRALLNHHPDKSKFRKTTRDGESEYTVDQITTAYEALSDPKSRSKYDLICATHQTRLDSVSEIHLPGLDVVDLDDLNAEEVGEMTTWSRRCRCGDPKGFCIGEGELEKDANQGEIVLGCKGCSLWLKVLFEVANDD